MTPSGHGLRYRPAVSADQAAVLTRGSLECSVISPTLYALCEIRFLER